MTKAVTIFVAVLIVCVGCGRERPKQTIQQRFDENRTSLAALRTMITQETKAGCFEVGPDHIGDYWGYDGVWTAANEYQTKLQLAQVLEKAHLTNERYTEYLRLLRACGASRISYCRGSHGGTRVIVYSAGMAVSGKMISLNLNDDGFVPQTDIQAGYSEIITSLADGWYIQESST